MSFRYTEHRRGSVRFGTELFVQTPTIRIYRCILEVVSPNGDELPYPILGERHRRVLSAQVGENLPEELLVVCSAYALVTVAKTLTKQLSHCSSSLFCTRGAAYP
jgi:hypothetical protein